MCSNLFNIIFFGKLRSSVYLVSLNKSKQLTIKLMSSSNFPHLDKPSAKNLGYRKPDGWIPSNIITQSVARGSHYGMSIYNGNRSEWSPIQSLVVRVISKIGRREGDSDLSITSMITGRIGRHEVLFFITVTTKEENSSILEIPQR